MHIRCYISPLKNAEYSRLLSVSIIRKFEDNKEETEMRHLTKSIAAPLVTLALLAGVALADSPSRTIPPGRRGATVTPLPQRVPIGSVSAVRTSPRVETPSVRPGTPSMGAHTSGGVTARRIVSAPPAPPARPVTSSTPQRSKRAPVVADLRRPLDRKPVTPVYHSRQTAFQYRRIDAFKHHRSHK